MWIVYMSTGPDLFQKQNIPETGILVPKFDLILQLGRVRYI